MFTGQPPTARVIATASALVATLLLAGCEERLRAGAAGKKLTPASGTFAAALVGPSTDGGGLVCQGTFAHDTHAALMTCDTCHPCAGTTSFDSPVTLPGGTTTAGGTITPSTDTSPATCSVACHDLSGASTQPVAWNAGKLMCTSCHSGSGPNGATLASSHPADYSSLEANRASCQGCHALGAHLSGNVRIDLGDGTTVEVTRGQPELTNPACQACHDGNGKALAALTPPVLVGWTEATGDFHGARAGTGYGGTLLAPYVRGQDPLACVTCHDAHGSTSEYLFRPQVNGKALAKTIDAAGVGGEALCSSCHSGARHQPCIDCHRDSGLCLEGLYGEAPSPLLCQNGVAIDPAPSGSACFFCHGHEGIVNFPPPVTPKNHLTSGGSGGGDCRHCHERGWFPAIERKKPVLQGAVAVNVGLDSATISWTTDEPSTSYVEFGVGSRNRIAGNFVSATSHQVTLTGLTSGTTYTYRLRSADRFRNVLLGAESTFSTGSADAPPAPVLIEQDWTWADWDWLSRVTLQWHAVTDPQGDPVEYRVMIDDDPFFGTPLESGWIPGTSFDVVLESERNWYWKVQARDATNGLTSPWSKVDQFYAQGWMDW